MNKEHYHHGDLKKEMIEKGLQLLNQEGYSNFSLRKVAALCGVSHAAPYKHFKNKEELIQAIIKETSQSFEAALMDAIEKFPGNPEDQIVELGKCYIKFMIENPDYMKFIFINPNKKEMGSLYNSSYDTSPYQIFKASALRYLKWINADPNNQRIDLLTLWSIVHGYSMLLVNNNLELQEDYLEIADKMFREKLRFK